MTSDVAGSHLPELLSGPCDANVTTNYPLQSPKRSGTATSAHSSCKPCAVRPKRTAVHFFPHTRPPDTHTTFTHALEVGDACLAYQRLLVNSYYTSDLCRPRGRARPPSASCDLCAFALTRSGDSIDLTRTRPQQNV
jgi:hypothetical protein